MPSVERSAYATRNCHSGGVFHAQSLAFSPRKPRSTLDPFNLATRPASARLGLARLGQTFTLLWLTAVSGAASAAATDAETPHSPISGFSATQAAAQHQREARFASNLNTSEMLTWLQELSKKPHHVGSVQGKVVADRVLELLRSWGYEAQLEEYSILLPTPRTRELALLEPETFTASLTEDTLEADPSTAERTELLPPYNAFSIDGEVEGELVFVNYGRPEDYEILERHGIDVKGKIAHCEVRQIVAWHQAKTGW